MTEPECECSVSRLRVNDGYEHDETCPLLIWHAFNEMSDEQRGDDRNDDGWCTVCNAEPWMWCDLVAHRQHDERAAGELWFDIAERAPTPMLRSVLGDFQPTGIDVAEPEPGDTPDMVRFRIRGNVVGSMRVEQSLDGVNWSPVPVP